MATKIKKIGGADGQSRLGQSEPQDEFVPNRFVFGSSTSGTPTLGEIEYNAASPDITTIVYINKTDDDSTTYAAILDAISSGDVLHLKSINRANSNVTFDVVGAITSTAGRVDIPVTFNSKGLGADFIGIDSISFATHKGVESERLVPNIVIKSHTDFQTPATTNSIVGYTLVDGEELLSVHQRDIISLVGVGITAGSTSVGLTGALQEFASDLEIVTASIPSADPTYYVEDGGDIMLTWNSVGANLDQSSAGSVTYIIKTFKTL